VNLVVFAKRAVAALLGVLNVKLAYMPIA